MADLVLSVFIPAFTVLAGAVCQVLCHGSVRVTHFFWGVELSLAALAFSVVELSSNPPKFIESGYGDINVGATLILFVILLVLFQVTAHSFYFRLREPPKGFGIALAVLGTASGFSLLGFAVDLLLQGS